MPATNRRRIDYQPGRAALEALDLVQRLRPALRQQELIDWLILTGASALLHPQWAPPPTLGEDRDRWTLPPGLRRDAEVSRR